MSHVADTRAGEAAAELKPPALERSRVAAQLASLVSSPTNIVLTLLALAIAYAALVPAVRFLVVDAVWTGVDREACLASTAGRPVGACWPFVFNRIGFFVYGQYPIAERWRVNVTALIAMVLIAWALAPSLPRRGIAVFLFFVPFPIVAFLLLTGSTALGLEPVPTNLWGGVLVTVTISLLGMVVSLPLGTVLALGRRSSMPIVRLVCVVLIEVIRGVPLIALLFMANRMLPLFLSPGMQPDSLLRVIVGVCLFASASMAEVIRGGLQALPKGQYEAAQSLGLGYWPMMLLIILPQALKLVIPGIVNTFISLFKDTTLVTIVGIFDFLTAVEVSANVPQWSSPVTSVTGYAFAAMFYFACCYAMSRYSLAMERRLATESR
ncbi:ABC transporter membrane protein [Chelatococcus reniformis]|uniref:ABC transporter membrane protein n=2 Tax=Chelatococcus reniformis TaxID=1494448 RepID=A0A916UFN7_9HYPH|nr:ABC transporter membrane protein [Chelatococcus reniformis]